jgi:eukaryotic-like serine/threonine-protein kinase
VTELVGQVLADRYRVIRPIAAGGMGVLFEVENTRIGRRFALKTLSSATAARPDSLARFRREAEIVARLHHPNIVAIVDWDALPGGAPFYVMELLEGEDLATRIGRGQVPWPELGLVASQAMSALGEAHRHGVLHRDLKPANVFLCRVGEGDGVHVKVLDFGLARARGNVAITNYDRPQWIGTPQYMSPEQIRGEKEPGEKADVWGLAAVLYEVATGQPAFSGPIDQLMKDIGNRRPVPVRVLRADAPEEFADAIEAALSPSPDRRITRVDELSARVRAALGVFNEATPVPPAPRRKPKPTPEVSASDTADDLPSSKRRRERVVRRAWVRGALVGGVIAAVAVAAMFAVWGMSGDDEGEAKTPAEPAKAAAATTTLAAPPAQPQPQPGPPPVPPAASAYDEAIAVPVRVRSRPGGAVVVGANGETVGFTPLVVEVTPGKPVSLILRHDGFEDLPVAVDGARPTELYHLERLGIDELCRRDPTRPECGLE